MPEAACVRSRCNSARIQAPSPRRSENAEHTLNATPSTTPSTNAPFSKSAIERMYVLQARLHASGGSADAAADATACARTLSGVTTTARSWTGPLSSATPAAGRAYYRAAKANSDYRSELVESRRGLNISEEDLIRLDGIVSPLIRQGQTPYMILKAHPEINLCEKTIYNYIDSGALSVKNIDLPKKVVYKIRRPRKDHGEATNQEIYEGRTYRDFKDFMKRNPDTRVTEMDTVIGCEGSLKILLTFHFNPCEFMMAYLLDSKEARHVREVFDAIEEAVGDILFNRAFPLILTDRGGEFQRPGELEADSDGVIRTSIYYCDPMCSWQKPHCEKNHAYIRRICPKGSSFDALTQDDVVLMMSHINSAPRESLGGHTPLEMARMILPEEILKLFGVKEIASDDVILTPKLLK